MPILLVRYPPGADTPWRMTPAAEQDRLVQAFLARYRDLGDPVYQAAMRATLDDDDIETLLIFCRRSWLSGNQPRRLAGLDAIAMLDLDQGAVPSAEVELAAAITLSMTAPEAVPPVLDRAAPATAGLLRRLVHHPPRLAELGYRWIILDEGTRLVPDQHAHRTDLVALGDLLLGLARLAEDKGYRVLGINQNDDRPAVLEQASAGDAAVAAAVARVRGWSGVPSADGPRRLTIHLLHAGSVADAQLLADTATSRSTHLTTVLGWCYDVACVIFVSDTGDSLDGHDSAAYALLKEPARVGRKLGIHPARPAKQPSPDTMLVIHVQYDSDLPAHQWWLSGPPARGTHPDPEGAWKTLVDDGDPFRGAETTTMDHHGPGWATVRGFWRGTWVEHRFSRNTGAGADEWDRLRPFLEPERFTTRPA
jgi:hypothetical protein